MCPYDLDRGPACAHYKSAQTVHLASNDIKCVRMLRLHRCRLQKQAGPRTGGSFRNLFGSGLLRHPSFGSPGVGNQSAYA